MDCLIEDFYKEGQRGDEKKFDGNKLMWDLIPWDVLEEVVKAYTHGAKKYGANCWQTVPDAVPRYEAAMFRHFVAYKKGETYSDDGLRHLAQVAWNAIALCWFDMHSIPEKEET